MQRNVQKGVKLGKTFETLDSSDAQEVAYLVAGEGSRMAKATGVTLQPFAAPLSYSPPCHAVGEYKLGNLSDARAGLVQILKQKPDFRQAIKLKSAVEDEMTSEALAVGAVGALAVVGGIAAVLLGAFLGGGKRR